MHQRFLIEKKRSLKLLRRACTGTLTLVQLKLQMHFSYRKAAAELQEGQTERRTCNVFCGHHPKTLLQYKMTKKATEKHDMGVLLTTDVFLLFQLWEEVTVNVHVWRRLFCPTAPEKPIDTVMLRWYTRQTGCQHSGLITVSISPVSVTPWHLSLEEILFNTRALRTLSVLCNPWKNLCTTCNPRRKAP